MAEILDTTLRDGSNAIGYAFTEDDIRTIVSGLAASGISFIEAGHGVSLGLSGPHWPTPAVSDERTLAIAREAAPDATLGAIAVPGLTTVAAIEPLLDSLDFLRLAPAPHGLDGCREFIRAAAGRGKAVFVQVVKTHRYEMASLLEEVQPLVDEGVDALYVVDTVGCMLPEDVTRYVAGLRDALRIPIGFHGHNNCSYALANSLAALSAGAEFIDATVGGIGRSAGNLQIELFVGMLQRRGECERIALERLFELSARLWNRFPNVARGVDPIEACFALHEWDSLSREDVLKTARARQIGVFALIRAVAGRAQGNFITPEDVEQAAAEFAEACR